MLSKDDVIFFLLAVTLLWVFLSVMGSIFKAAGNCGAEYPIGTILHTNLFCEIVKEQDNV
tara:strand:- start:417 stop:596 length:180 start_codon:yes stop_codon:yes gene_type:complete